MSDNASGTAKKLAREAKERCLMAQGLGLDEKATKQQAIDKAMEVFKKATLPPSRRSWQKNAQGQFELVTHADEVWSDEEKGEFERKKAEFLRLWGELKEWMIEFLNPRSADWAEYVLHHGLTASSLWEAARGPVNNPFKAYGVDGCKLKMKAMARGNNNGNEEGAGKKGAKKKNNKKKGKGK